MLPQRTIVIPASQSPFATASMHSHKYTHIKPKHLQHNQTLPLLRGSLGDGHVAEQHQAQNPTAGPLKGTSSNTK